MISSDLGCARPSRGVRQLSPDGRSSHPCPDCRSDAEPINFISGVECVGGSIEDGVQFSCSACHIRFLANEKGFRRVLVWGSQKNKVQTTA